MRIQVLNVGETDFRVRGILGEDVDNYRFRAALSSREIDPEKAYERVNQNTFLHIDGLSMIGKKFDEDKHKLEVEKSDYADELATVSNVDEELQDQGYDYFTTINAEFYGEEPAEAIHQMEDVNIKPVMIYETENWDSIIFYEPDKKETLDQAINPKDGLCMEKAREHEDQVQDIINALE